MIFITGPLFSGKQTYIIKALGWTEEDFQSRAVRDAHILSYSCDDLNILAEKLSQYEVVTADETGAGVVPIDPVQREQREKAGRLCCMLAEKADTVIRVYCGIPQVLKGELP